MVSASHPMRRMEIAGEGEAIPANLSAHRVPCGWM